MIKYLDGNIDLEHGIYVANIDENGPAYRSGIRTGDIITHIDGREIDTMMELRSYIYSKDPGDKVTVIYDSKGETKEVEIILAAKRRLWGKQINTMKKHTKSMVTSTKTRYLP